MTTWIGETTDGEQVHMDHAPRKADGDFARVAKSKHDPCARGTQQWDFDAERWVTVTERALSLVDQDHAHDVGDAAIAGARWMKAIEATLIAAGQPVPGGMIEAEAAAAGIEPADLARIVLSKHHEQTLRPELARIASKRALREQEQK